MVTESLVRSVQSKDWTKQERSVPLLCRVYAGALDLALAPGSVRRGWKARPGQTRDSDSARHTEEETTTANSVQTELFNFMVTWSQSW